MSVGIVSLRGYQLRAAKDGPAITVNTGDVPVEPQHVEGGRVELHGQGWVVHRAIDPFKPPHARSDHPNAGKFLELWVAKPDQPRPKDLPEPNTAPSASAPAPEPAQTPTRRSRTYTA